MPAQTRSVAKRSAAEVQATDELIKPSRPTKHAKKETPVPLPGRWIELPHKAGRVWRAAASEPVEHVVASQPKEDIEHNGKSGPRKTMSAGLAATSTSVDTRSEIEHKHSIDPSSPQICGKEVPKKKRARSRKTADNPQGIMFGETPYPDMSRPTAAECEEVFRILSAAHVGVEASPPAIIPSPSLEVAGCGEVPCVLDGLLRTVLSASTTFESADSMLKALHKRFGSLDHGVGKGSIDWNNVRLADYEDVYAQLRHAGLGGVKAKHIQGILNEVFAERAVLSLDHMHSMTTEDAMKHLVRFRGVGVKTAACVTLFSLQRPCFAVDTHVFRMSRWLGWIPPNDKDRDRAFYHLELRTPDHLKYGLHQLFIRHGKDCHRCNDMSVIGTAEWDKTVCPLEAIINRFSKSHAKPKEVKQKKQDNNKGQEGSVKSRGKDKGKSRNQSVNEQDDDDEDNGLDNGDFVETDKDFEGQAKDEGVGIGEDPEEPEPGHE